MTRQADLEASERAMQLICATIHNGQTKVDQMLDIDKIVNTWVFHAHLLTSDCMKEDLPQVEGRWDKQNGKWVRT
jgi:hypothetical protein